MILLILAGVCFAVGVCLLIVRHWEQMIFTNEVTRKQWKQAKWTKEGWRFDPPILKSYQNAKCYVSTGSSTYEDTSMISCSPLFSMSGICPVLDNGVCKSPPKWYLMARAKR